MLANVARAGQVAWQELGLLFWEWFLLPGEHVMRTLLDATPALAAALGQSSIESSAGLASIVAAVFWLAALWTLFRLWTSIRDLDRVLTSWCRRGHREAARRLRVARRFVICTLQRVWRKPRAPEWTEANEIELSTFELALLVAQLRVVPGGATTARDLAVGHRVSAGKVRHVLKRLVKLGLVEVERAGGDERFRLTAHGKLFLGSLARRQPSAEGRRSDRAPARPARVR